MPYFVTQFTNTAHEAEVLEKLCPEANFFYVSLTSKALLLICAGPMLFCTPLEI